MRSRSRVRSSCKAGVAAMPPDWFFASRAESWRSISRSCVLAWTTLAFLSVYCDAYSTSCAFSSALRTSKAPYALSWGVAIDRMESTIFRCSSICRFCSAICCSSAYSLSPRAPIAESRASRPTVGSFATLIGSRPGTAAIMLGSASWPSNSAICESSQLASVSACLLRTSLVWSKIETRSVKNCCATFGSR